MISCPSPFHVCISLESVISLKGFPSVKSTRSLWWSVQLLCLCHHRKWRLRWVGVTCTHRASHSAIKTHFYNLLTTVKHDIGHPIVRCMCFVFSHAAWRFSLLDCRTRYRSSTAIVVRGKPLLHTRAAVLVVWNVLQAGDTMLWAMQNSSAKLVSLWLSSNFPMILFQLKLSRFRQ